MKVLLDTSSIEYAAKHKQDVESDLDNFFDSKIELFITKGVQIELEEHQEEKSIRGRGAKLGIMLLNGLMERKRLKRIAEPLEGTHIVDEVLINVAKSKKLVLLTQDKALRKEATSKGVMTITYRRNGTIGG